MRSQRVFLDHKNSQALAKTSKDEPGLAKRAVSRLIQREARLRAQRRSAHGMAEATEL
jgi:hypothetical protein